MDKCLQAIYDLIVANQSLNENGNKNNYHYEECFQKFQLPTLYPTIEKNRPTLDRFSDVNDIHKGETVHSQISRICFENY